MISWKRWKKLAKNTGPNRCAGFKIWESWSMRWNVAGGPWGQILRLVLLLPSPNSLHRPHPPPPHSPPPPPSCLQSSRRLLRTTVGTGWLGPTKIGDLPPAERFSNNLNISNQRQPSISAQNEKSDFSRGMQDILTDRVYQLPRKAFKLPFLERQNKNNQNPTKLRMLCVTKDA